MKLNLHDAFTELLLAETSDSAAENQVPNVCLRGTNGCIIIGDEIDVTVTALKAHQLLSSNCPKLETDTRTYNVYKECVSESGERYIDVMPLAEYIVMNPNAFGEIIWEVCTF